MKVLYIATAYDRHPGDGITPWLVETIHRLRERDVEIEVLAPSYRGLQSGRVEGVMVHRFRYAPAPLETLTHDQHAPDRIRERPLYGALLPGYLASSALAARRLAATGRFDAAHAHWPLPHAVPGWAARRRGLPLTLTFHGVEVTFARNAGIPGLVPFLRRAIRTADAVTANSSYTAGLIRELHDRPIEIIPFGSTVGGDETPSDPAQPASPPAQPPSSENAAAPDADPAESTDQASILFVGRLVERKGVQHLVEAMTRLEDRSAHLHVVGEGPMKPELERIARERYIKDRITFHGFVPAGELRRRFAACDVFVLPAVYDAKGDVEGLGVVLIEALSYGRPVVASRAGGIVDVIRDRETGLLVPPGDVAALADAIRSLLDDPELARSLGEAGRRHVRENFSWDAITDRLVALYHRLVSEAS